MNIIAAITSNINHVSFSKDIIIIGFHKSAINPNITDKPGLLVAYEEKTKIKAEIQITILKNI